MKCRTCGAPIFWAKTQAGKAIPIDKEPVPRGNMVVTDGVAIVVKPHDGLAYVSHFATCAQSDQHRRPR